MESVSHSKCIVASPQLEEAYHVMALEGCRGTSSGEGSETEIRITRVTSDQNNNAHSLFVSSVYKSRMPELFAAFCQGPLSGESWRGSSHVILSRFASSQGLAPTGWLWLFL
jgi:hypothetical protein